MAIEVFAAKPDKDFIKIFDGKTLDGWEAMPAKTRTAAGNGRLTRTS